MEVFRGKYNHAGFFKSKKEKKTFSGECGFFIYVSQTGPKFVKSQSLQLIRYHVCVAKKVELPFK